MSNGNNSSNHDAANAGDVQQMFMQQAMQSMDSLNKHQYKPGEETTKLFGFIELDSGFASMVNALYTGFGKQISDYISPKIYSSMVKFGPGIKRMTGIALEGKALNQTAAGVTLAVNLGVFLQPDVTKLYNLFHKQQDARETLRRRLSSFMDATYGGHSLSTFNRIPLEDSGKWKGNSVIVAHRRQMHKDFGTENWNVIINSVVRNGLNLVGQAANIEALRTGDTLSDVHIRRESELGDRFTSQVAEEWQKRGYKPYNYDRALKEEVVKRINKEQSGGNLLGFVGGGTLLAKFADAITTSSERRLKATRQPYSALEMILALEEQVQNNPGGANRFALPAAPGERHGRELPLDQFVAEIFRQHQKEMLDIDPRNSEIRDALKNDLLDVSRMIAEQIQAGELNPQMLVRLVGEGMVVKNRGHGLAGVEEVKELLEKYASRSQSFAVTDAKKYVAERNFTIEHVKEDLKSLEGEERIHYAATLPDQVLRVAGMSDSDIHTVQEQRARFAHDVFLMRETLGVDARPDEELREAGLGSTQIKRLHKDAEMIRKGGEKAVRKLKSGPTNADGLEHIVNDFVTPKIAGDKEYLGKLLATGREALENPRVQEAANDHDGETRGKQGHAEKFKPKTRPDHANDNHGRAANDDDFDDELSHAERLAATRGHSHGHSKAYD